MNQERVFKVLLGPHVSEGYGSGRQERPVRFQGCY